MRTGGEARVSIKMAGPRVYVTIKAVLLRKLRDGVPLFRGVDEVIA